MGQDSYKTFVAVAVLLAVATVSVQGSHFRGGTISWKSEGGTKVHFYFKLGWRYGKGPGCTAEHIGKHVTGMSSKYWVCQSNNCGAHNLHDTTYFCTGADQTENWEQGRNDFEFTFPKTGGPFTVGYADYAWIQLSNGKGNGNWNVATTVDLRRRSDTGGPNSSPESLSKPMYYVPFDCQVHIKLPVIDPDNDKFRCRWAMDDECKTVCHALPHAHLDEETCTVSFNTTAANGYELKGIYAVALTIEDFPRLPIKMGDKRPTTWSPDDVMSSIPLQFLVQTIDQPCNAGPRFVSPTPEEGEVISVEEGSNVEIGLYADNKNDTSSKANKITASGPIAMILSPVTPDVNRTNTYTATLTWQTSHSDVGGHIVCASVSNDKGMSGAQRCFTIDVVPKGCGSSPCQNDGKCLTNNYVCICRPGFTGRECEDNIDDCASSTCPEGTYCLDGINSYTCPKNTTNTCTCP